MESKRTKFLYKAALAGLNRDLVEAWSNRLTAIELEHSYDLISDFLCLRSRSVLPILRKNPQKYFKHLGFVKEAIEALIPLTKKFKHLTYLQVALNFARSRFLRSRKPRCQTDLNCWKPLTLPEASTSTYINEQGLEVAKPPLQIHVYNCANYAALINNLARLKDMAQKAKQQLLFHGTTWTKAQSVVKGINIDSALPHSEFSVDGAFYLTDDWHVAHLHAMSKTTICGYDDPAIVIYTVSTDLFDNREDHLKLQEDPDLWQTVVERCRDPTDRYWKDRWDTFISNYSTIEGPVPLSDVLNCDPDAAPMPKCNTWQLAIINDEAAQRMSKCMVGVVVWGDEPEVVIEAPSPVAASVAKNSHVPEVIDVDMTEQMSPITTPKKIAVK